MSDMEEGVFTPHHCLHRAKERYEMSDLAGAKEWCDKAVKMDATFGEHDLVKEIYAATDKTTEED